MIRLGLFRILIVVLVCLSNDSIVINIVCVRVLPHRKVNQFERMIVSVAIIIIYAPAQIVANAIIYVAIYLNIWSGHTLRDCHIQRNC